MKKSENEKVVLRNKYRINITKLQMTTAESSILKKVSTVLKEKALLLPKSFH